MIYVTHICNVIVFPNCSLGSLKQVCVGIEAGEIWFFTTQDPLGTLGVDAYNHLSAQTTYANMADCVAAYAPWVASTPDSPINYPPGTNSLSTSNRFNAAFNVDAVSAIAADSLTFSCRAIFY